MVFSLPCDSEDGRLEVGMRQQYLPPALGKMNVSFRVSKALCHNHTLTKKRSQKSEVTIEKIWLLYKFLLKINSPPFTLLMRLELCMFYLIEFHNIARRQVIQALQKDTEPNRERYTAQDHTANE